MTALLIGMSAIAGMGLGWYGYKAHLRIEAWGQNMNACDQIFQIASGEMPDGFQGPAKDGRRIASLAGPNLHPGAAASK
jgi:hypothetical protein